MRPVTDRRIYRNAVRKDHLVPFQVTVRETDLHLQADDDFSHTTRNIILKQRRYIENHIRRFPDFLTSLSPVSLSAPAPRIIRDMTEAGRLAGVGPMAAVAGAVAEHVGYELLSMSNEIIIENGGDIFLKVFEPVTIGIYAGDSPFSMKIGVRIHKPDPPCSMCTSSGRIGHSLNFGKANTVSVLSASASTADAAATAVSNKIHSESDIQKGMDFGKTIQEVTGIVIIINDKIGIWGDIEIVPLT